jgi:Asp-tRNA(Asn)/Glu-tRNA(Gln) amidotransferase A subunit family amidase
VGRPAGAAGGDETERLLCRIDAINPGFGAIVELRRKAALQAATAADALLAAGAEVGPLHGVPISIKKVVVAPIGRTDAGLPVGVQIVGPLYEDDTALTFAELLTAQVGGYTPPPI